ncbi:MAG TPA: PQQ-binding-like beta-propeller repeat protein [Vicinamibacterales bacterium]|nr:PQQ-binding-like beta-propeller repeat protein [Vicinamibacterales bacterium]
MRVTIFLVAWWSAVLLAGSTPAEWPQWRGPFNTGMARGDAPLRWNDATNIRWKVAIPGKGHSTPVVAGTHMFLTTAVPTGRRTAPAGRGRAGGGADAGLEHRFEVLAVERETGCIAWQRTATVATPHEGYHRIYGSFASNSPVTDGTRLFAFFGSRGLFAYDLNGTLLWHKDFGVRMRMDMAFGEGTPLTLHDGRLLLHFDHLATGFLVMLDPATGREIWRVKRTERFNWAAPYVATHDGRRQIIMSGETVRGYDFDSGEFLWEAAGLGENTIPQPVQHDDLVFAMSGHTIRMLMAIRLGRRGNLTDTDAIVWTTPRGASYTPSPLLHDGRLYVLTDSGLLSAFDAATGKMFYQQARLPKPYSFKASPVGANGKLYLATEDEDVVVVRMGDRLEVLAINTLEGQSFIASPVIVDGVMYLRSQTHLFAVSER